SFTCCCNAFTVSVRDCTCWRSASTSAAAAGVEFETFGAGDGAETGVTSCAKPVVTGKIASVIKIIFFIQNSRLRNSGVNARTIQTLLRSARDDLAAQGT